MLLQQSICSSLLHYTQDKGVFAHYAVFYYLCHGRGPGDQETVMSCQHRATWMTSYAVHRCCWCQKHFKTVIGL